MSRWRADEMNGENEEREAKREQEESKETSEPEAQSIAKDEL